jgi:ribonucleoside-triphosphate reductase (thioredoxin)
MLDIDRVPFKLAEAFIARYANTQPMWGPVGYVTFKRTYARALESCPARIQELAAKYMPTQTAEEFWLTCVRVVEGTFRVQQRHCLSLGLPWSNVKAQRSAQDMFERMWCFKFLPPGRGLWMMGTDYMEKCGGAALNNCAFTSTSQIHVSFSAPFCFLMDMSMLGLGVGGDTEGAGTVTIRAPEFTDELYTVEDSREGWVALVKRVLDAYVGEATLPLAVSYAQVRPAGSPIQGFGGTASGPEPLRELVETIQYILDPLIGLPITAAAIVDLFNVIGRCVVAGNVRRSAEIMFGRAGDADFRRLKDRTDLQARERLLEAYKAQGGPYEMIKFYEENIANDPVNAWRWASNNSIFAQVGMDYAEDAALTAKNGEPGYLWLENARAYGRMIDPPNYKDQRVAGSNPCVEQSLESNEVCTLVETFPANHDSAEDYERTLKMAYMYAKTVTLVPTHDARTNAVMLRNRRIGCSMSGIVQALHKFGRRRFFTEFCDAGYSYLQRLDAVYSDWLCVPRSIKTTSVKPSGTVSLLPGSTPGMHYPEDEYYFRVIRFDSKSPLLDVYRAAGYRVEEIDPRKEPNTTVIYFAIQEQHYQRGKGDVTMWEQLELCAQLQAFWADNQVSCTVTFQPHEAKDIQHALELYERRLKGISFLPYLPASAAAEEYKKRGYEHVPYQAITREVYEAYTKNLQPVNLELLNVKNENQDKYCDSDRCALPGAKVA